jgi:N-acetylmuramoyl-L-alanine amidase
MDIIKDITNRNRKIYNNRKISYIVIHYVGAVSSAKANAQYFKNTYRGASAHYFVDEKDIYQVVEDKDAAWHCGATYYKHLYCRNSNSIGIEMCCFKKNGKLDVSENVVNRTIELTRELMKKYNIPVQNVLRHYDVTGKNCPAPFVSDPARWTNFINKLTEPVQGKYKAGQNVEINVKVGIAFEQGNKCLVDDGNNQFWVDKSVINSESRIVARATICFVCGTSYIVQVFDDQFWVKESDIVKVLN